MINKPYNLFIGKDIDRTTELAAGAGFDVVSANIAEGEIVVLDENLQVLAETATSADSSLIYIAEGTSQTIDFHDEEGTAISGRRVLLSNPIQHKLLRKVNWSTYTAKSEATAEIPAITDSIVEGTEYVLRLVYSDIESHPGQFTQTYRYVAKSGDASQDVFDGLRSRIANHKGTRVTAGGTTTLTLTAKPIPESTTRLDNIDEFKMVDFDLFFNYVTSDGNWEEVGLGSDITHTHAIHGLGNWEQLRDLEKVEMGYRGITNRTHFPIIQPDFRTVTSNDYNMFTIEYDEDYRSPDNSYEKFTSKRVLIALPVTTDDGAVPATSQVINVAEALCSWLGITQDVYTAAP